MSLLPHIPHYTGGSNACAAAQPLFCHISEVKSLFGIYYGTRNQKCVHEFFGITTKRICLQTPGLATPAPVQLPTAPRSPSAAQRLHHLQAAEIRESMSILYLIKLVTSMLSPGFPSSAGSYKKWVKINVLPSSSGILISYLSCQHIKFYNFGKLLLLRFLSLCLTTSRLRDSRFNNLHVKWSCFGDLLCQSMPFYNFSFL